MSFQARFTEEERLLLASTPTLIGSAMAFAESSGLATVKELMESAKSYMAALEAYPDNEIIQGILPNLEDRKEAMAQAKDFRDKTLARLKDKGIDAPEKIRSLLIEDSQHIKQLLKEKANPKEAAEYKQWAMSVAANVAKAAKEGGFLGFGGERVSEGERALFADLGRVLETDTRLG